LTKWEYCNYELYVEKDGNIDEPILPEISLDGIPILTHEFNIVDFTKNENNTEDVKINLCLLDLSLALRDYIYFTKNNSVTFEKVKENSENCIYLNNWTELQQLKSNNKLLNELKSVLQKSNLIRTSTNPLKSGIIQVYEPAIYIPNALTADFTKMPLICPGFEVNSELPGMEKYKDYIVGFFFDPENKFKEILINEEIAMKTDHPVVIVTNAEIRDNQTEILMANYRKEIQTISTLKSAQSVIEYHSHEYQINYRYEGSGDSEFCISAATIDENGNIHLNLIDNGVYKSWKKIADVPKNKIGVTLSIWQQFTSIDVTPHENNYTFWNTFERDWYASQKSLGSGSRNGKTVYLSGNMKFNDEWYAYDPSEVNNNPVDYAIIFNTWAKWHINHKGKFRIWKVEKNNS
jgi:hypothetical protein